MHVSADRTLGNWHRTDDFNPHYFHKVETFSGFYDCEQYYLFVIFTDRSYQQMSNSIVRLRLNVCVAFVVLRSFYHRLLVGRLLKVTYIHLQN